MRSDHPQSLRGYIRLIGPSWPVFEALDHSLQTGHPAVEALAPRGVWEWLGANPQFAQVFDQAMTSKAQGDLAALLDAYDFSAFGSFADIGGGQGHLLQTVLDNVPGATGTLFDQPIVVESARHRLGVRVTLVGGDFFKDALSKVDAYLLMQVIHDWDDKRAISILQNVRSAALPRSKLLLIEVPLTESPAQETTRPARASFLHFSMLA